MAWPVQIMRAHVGNDTWQAHRRQRWRGAGLYARSSAGRAAHTLINPGRCKHADIYAPARGRPPTGCRQSARRRQAACAPATVAPPKRISAHRLHPRPRHSHFLFLVAGPASSSSSSSSTTALPRPRPRPFPLPRPLPPLPAPPASSLSSSSSPLLVDPANPGGRPASKALKVLDESSPLFKYEKKSSPPPRVAGPDNEFRLNDELPSLDGPFDSSLESKLPPSSSLGGGGGGGALDGSEPPPASPPPPRPPPSPGVARRRAFVAGGMMGSASPLAGPADSATFRAIETEPPQVVFSPPSAWTPWTSPFLFKALSNLSSSSSAVLFRAGAGFLRVAAVAARAPSFLHRADVASSASASSAASIASTSCKAFTKASKSLSHIVSIVVFCKTSNSAVFSSLNFLISSTFSKVKLQRFMPNK
mmetsp:Transcript_21783/g.70435  ORF Transcript_21783/g.70435 Transcript_21783/m.70435 type:complete len:419 (+) Transcript_21783:55-1311(+)